MAWVDQLKLVSPKILTTLGAYGLTLEQAFNFGVFFREGGNFSLSVFCGNYVWGDTIRKSF